MRSLAEHTVSKSGLDCLPLFLPRASVVTWVQCVRLTAFERRGPWPCGSSILTQDEYARLVCVNDRRITALSCVQYYGGTSHRCMPESCVPNVSFFPFKKATCKEEYLSSSPPLQDVVGRHDVSSTFKCPVKKILGY